MAQAKQTPKPDDAPAAVAGDLTLDEFCTRLSINDSRVELISAFASVEAAAGVIKDTETAFQDRFVKFTNQPA